jgi:hypothetical protein
MSHVLKILKEYESITGGRLSVSGNQVQFIANNGSYIYIDFDKQIADIMRGASSGATVRIRTN